MNREDSTNYNSLCESTVKMLRPCVSFLTNFTCGHSIHPLEPASPQFSEYLILPHCRRLRIIHILPNTTLKNSINDVKLCTSRSSLSGEYWFTRWNKPLKLGNCNCSFRRSQRFSALSLSTYSPLSISLNINSKSPYNIPPTKIVNLEIFVERLIQETLLEVFQVMKTSTNIYANIRNDGISNCDFNYREVDAAVLRKPEKLSFEKKVSVKTCLHIKSGLKEKPAVILLHGIGSSADVWWNIINTLVQKGYEIIAPDMLGHGYSSIPNQAEAYMFRNLLKYTLSVFDRYIGCNETRKAIIIGHSFGCSLATALCRYRSQQIVQLILISGGGPTPLAPPPTNDAASVCNFFQMLLKPFVFCGMRRTLFYSLRGKHFNACDTENAVPSHILRYFADGQNWPEGDAAFHRRILIPTLLVHGLQDTLITLVQQCEMERTIPRAFLELIPNAGHMCMLETPEHLSHMIMCFIDWWSR
ncbi:hypothetical protein FQA39_LY07135 [Lamprigera yunnana]|nr:hypothetical protein FQA39_LY07135 [Lamprigera yunnana]